MATEADIPASICETRMEQGVNLVDQATNILSNKLPQEEKTQADTLNGPPTVEGKDFLTTPSVDKVHCEVNKISPDESKDTEKSNVSDKDEDRATVTVEYSVTKAGDMLHDTGLDNVRADSQLSEDTRDGKTTDDDASCNFAENLDAVAEEANEENSTFLKTITHVSSGDDLQGKNDSNSSFCEDEDESIQKGDRVVTIPEDSGVLMDIVTDQGNPKVTEKTGESSCVQVAGSQTEHDVQLDKESENLPLAEVLMGGSYDKVIDKAIDEDVSIRKAELFENVETEKPVESLLHVDPGNIEASSLSQENKTSSPEEHSTKANLYGIMSDDIEKETIPTVDTQKEVLESFPTIVSTSAEEGSINAALQGVEGECKDEKTNDEVETQKEVLENFPTVVPNAEIEENSIEVDCSKTKEEEPLEKESEEISLPLPLAREANDDKSVVMHEAQVEDREPRKAEFYENEKSTESILLKIEPKIEKPEDSSNVTSEDIRESDLGEEIEPINYIEQQSVTAQPRAILDEKTYDAAETNEEILEKFPTVVNEEIEETSIEVDASETKDEEPLEKESKKNSLPLTLAPEDSDDESVVVQEAQAEDGELRNAELCEIERSTESILLKIEPEIEKTKDSSNVAYEDIKESDLGEEIEPSSYIKQQSVTMQSQTILDEKTNEKAFDAAETKEETLENFPTVVSHAEIEESSIKVDGSVAKDEEPLEKESEKISLPLTLAREDNDDESVVGHEDQVEDGEPGTTEFCEIEKITGSSLLKIEPKIERTEDSSNVAYENIKESDLGEEIEPRSYIEQQSVTTQPQAVLDEKTFDAAETNDRTLENFPTAIPHAGIEENSIKVDGSKTKDEPLEKESEKISLPREDNGDESVVVHEAQREDGELRKAELCEIEKITGSYLLKIDPEIEKTEDSTNVVYEDIKESDLGEEIEPRSYIEQQTVTTQPQTVLDEKADERTFDAAEPKEETLENFSTVVNAEIQENSIEVDDSETKDEEPLEKESEKNSLPLPLAREANDDKLVVKHEAQVEEGEPRKTELCENEISTENILLKIEPKIEKSEDSLNVASEDIKESNLGEEIEPRSNIEQQSVTAQPQAILDEKTDEKTFDAAETEETPENFPIVVPNAEIEENSIKVDVSETKDEEPLGKENALPLPLLKETNNDKSVVMHEAQVEDGEPRKAEICENEKNAESSLLKIEPEIQKSEDSSNVVSGDIKESDLGEEIEPRSYIEQQCVSAQPQGMLDEKTFDAAETEKETLENFPTVVPKAEIEENSIEVDDSETKNEKPLEKESEKIYLPIPLAREANDDESVVMNEAQVKDGEPRKAELCGNEKNTESILLKIEPEIEKSEDFLIIASEDIKESDLVEEIEPRSYIEQLSVTTQPQAVLYEKTDEKTFDATETKDETLENFPTVVPNAEIEENSIKVDVSETKGEEPSEKEKVLPLPLAREANDDESVVINEAQVEDGEPRKDEICENEKIAESSLLKIEPEIEKPEDSSNVASKDIKESDLGEEIEPKSFIDQQNVTTQPQEVLDEKAFDAVETNEKIIENFSIAVPNAEIEENLINVDTSETKDKQPLEKESEKLSSSLPLAKEANDDESVVICETQVEDGELRNTELCENEISTTSISPKIEPEIEKVGNVASEDIRDSDLGQEIETRSYVNQQSVTTQPEAILNEKTDEKTLDVAETKEETLESFPTVVPNAEKEENSINVDGLETKDEEPSKKETEKMSSPLTMAREANDDDESIVRKAALCENEKSTESILLKIEPEIETAEDPLIVASEDIKEFDLGQDMETRSYIEQQSVPAQPQTIVGEKTNEKTLDATETKEEFLEVQNVPTIVSDEKTERNSLMQVDSTRMKNEDHLEKDSVASLIKDFTENTNNDVLTTKDEIEVEDENPSRPELLQEEKNIECDLDQHTETTGFLKEQSLSESPEGIPCDKSEEKTIDAVDSNEKTQEDSEEASLIRDFTGNTNDDVLTTKDEIEVEDENPSRPELLQEEKNIESGLDQHTETANLLKEQSLIETPEGISGDKTEERTIDAAGSNEKTREDSEEACLVEEEAPIISLEVSDEDIKASASGQDRETSYLEEQGLPTNPPATVDDHKEDKSIDATETPEDKNVATTTLQVNKDINASASDHDVEEQNPTADPQEIACDKPEEETNDATYTEEQTLEVQDIVTNVPSGHNEDNLPIEDGSQKSLKEAELFENENNAECTLVKKDTETSSLPLQSQTISPQEIMVSHQEDRATDLKEETPEHKNIAPAIPYEETETSSIKEKTVATDPQETLGDNIKEENTDATATKEETLEVQDIVTNVPNGDNEDKSPIEVAEYIRASASCKDREISSLEEHSTTANPPGILGDNKEDEAIDLTDLSEETSKDKVPKEIEQVDTKGVIIELNEEEIYPRDLHMTTAVDIAAHEEKGSSPIAVKIPSTNDLDVTKYMVVDIAEDPNCKQEESSITEVSEEHMMMSNENVVKLTSLASEASGSKSDYEAGNDEKEVEEELIINASQDVSESDEVNGAEQIYSYNCKETSDGSNSAALEEVSSSNMASEEDSTSNPFQETRRETLQETEIEEAWKQDKELHISALGQDSSVENTEKDARLCLASAYDSDNNKEVQKLEEESVPAPDDNITEKTYCEVPEDATRDKDIEHLEHDNTTTSFLDSQKPTAGEQDETECRQVLLDETVEETKESTSIPVANDFFPKSSIETSETDYSTTKRELTIDTEELHTGKTATCDDEESKQDKNEEEEAGEQKIPDFSSAAPNMIEAGEHDVARLLSEATEENFTCEVKKEANTFEETTDITERTVINERPIADIETVPTATEDQEVESTSVQEIPALTSQCDRDGYERAGIGSLIVEKLEPNVVEVAPEGNKSKEEEAEAECGQVLLDETVEETKEPTSIPVANDFLPKSSIETSEADYSTTKRELTIDKEELHTGKTATVDDEETENDKDRDKEEAGEQKIPGFSSAAPNLIEARDHDASRLLSEAPEEKITSEVKKEANTFEETTDITESTVINERPIADIETVPTVTEDQEVEITSVQEIPALTSQCERDEYEHAGIGNMIREKLEPNVVEVAPEENKSEYESKNQVLEPIAQVQSCDIIPKAKETKVEEENLEAPAAVIKSEEVVAEDILQPKETPYGKESTKVNIPSEKFKEEDEDLEDYHLRSCKEEVVTESHLEDEVKQEEEINTEEPFEIIKNANETDKVKSSTVEVLEDEDNRTGADENKMAKDESSLNQNSNTSVIDAAAAELPKRLDENIICEEDSEGKNEDANTIVIQHHEVDKKSMHESLQLPEFTQEQESEKQDQKYEICGSEVQAKDEENFTAGEGEEKANGANTWTRPTEDEDRNTFVEAAHLDFSSHTEDASKVLQSDGAQDILEDTEKSTTENKYAEETYTNESTEPEISTVSENIELIDQPTKDRTTAEMQQEAESDSSAAPEATGLDSQQVEEVSDEGKGMAEASTQVEPTTISTLEIMHEFAVETSLETKDQQIKLDDLPQESNVTDSEVKMAQKDGPLNLQNVRDISEDMKKLNEGSVEVSNKDNPVEVYPSENIEAGVSSEGQETENFEKAFVSESLNQEIEEQQQGSTSEAVPKAKGENCEEDKVIGNRCNDLIENSSSGAAEKVSESNIHQSSMEDTAQNDKKEEIESQNDSLPILPHVKCSDIKIAEKELLMHPARLEGTDVTELEVSPLPSKDKHVVLEADHTKNANPENSTGNKNFSAIQHGDSVECGELEIPKPSKYDPEEADCGREERTSQETTDSGEKSESNEMDKHSLSDLLQGSMKRASEMTQHSAIEEDPIIDRAYLKAEKTDEAEHEDTKFNEEKDHEEESTEQKTDLGSEAPVMVDMADVDVKTAHKKSHNILSGVGSKMKHSIAKVKKAIIGKSSHPKPPSPK